MPNPINHQAIERIKELIKEYDDSLKGDQQAGNLLLSINEVVDVWKDDCELEG